MKDEQHEARLEQEARLEVYAKEICTALGLPDTAWFDDEPRRPHFWGALKQTLEAVIRREVEAARTVRPLEWEERKIVGGETRVASTDGRYWLSRVSDGYMVIGEDDKGYVSRLPPQPRTVYPTLELAKAGADALNREFILRRLA